MMHGMGPAWEQSLRDLQAIEDPFERRLAFVALLSDAIAGPPPVVVGGHAVEFHSLGSYTTGDIDLAVLDKGPIEKVLSDWGFEKRGRVWWRADVGIAVDLIAIDLARADDQVAQIKLHCGTVQMLCVEEMIVDRLAACVHSQVEDDCRWARQILDLNRDGLRVAYLEQRAAEEGVGARLREIMTGRGPDHEAD